MIKIAMFLTIIVLSYGCNREVYKVSIKEGCKVIDRKGRVVFSANFVLYFFDDGLAEFEDTVNDLHGYITKNGKIAFPSEYYGVVFSEGLGSVSLTDNTCGFINKKGRLILKPRYNGIDLICRRRGLGLFSEGLAVMGYPSKDSTYHYVYINKKGNVKFEMEFIYACDFKNGLASVCFLDSTNGYIDKKGRLKISLPMGQFGHSFSEGLAWIGDDGDSCYLINKKGKRISQEKFLRPSAFQNGRARIEKKTIGDIYYGFINRKGEIVIEPQYRHAFNFSNGLASVEKKIEGKYGDFETYIINLKGEVVLGPYKNMSIREFVDGVAPGNTRILGDSCTEYFFIIDFHRNN